MDVTSIFDILEPVMVGPSSSHTAGAGRIGLLSRSVLGASPEFAEITLFGSFAQTGRGHGTDKAILAGLLGILPDDVRLRYSEEIARRENMRFRFSEGKSEDDVHPNTVRLVLSLGGEQVELWASSLGAGRVNLWRINGFRCEIDGTSPVVLIWHKDRPGVIGRVASVCGEYGMNISRFSSARRKPGGDALMCAVLDYLPDEMLVSRLNGIGDVQSVKIIKPVTQLRKQGMFGVPNEIYEKDIGADEFGKMIIELESHATNVSGSEISNRLDYIIKAMQESVESGRGSEELSVSGLVGVEHALWNEYCIKGVSLFGDLQGRIIRDALAVAGLNAKMGRIVAAPTAGASGVLPAVMLNVASHLGCEAERLRESLAVAGLIGAIIGKGASLSGAECGCQAECGSASAMAAGCACFLKGLSSKKIFNAASLALKNHLGLTCDPVAGLVEVPCVKRNAFSAMTAITACELASSDIVSVIPFNEIVRAMYQTGKMIAPALRESGQAGLANTETAKKIAP